jgi:RNA polymerase sigma factor (sigma-70 family)
MENNTEKISTIEKWVYQYGDGLFSWAMSKTKSKELSEDLVQETFISGFKSFDKFENRSNPKTWLIAILNNKIIDHYRKKSNVSADTMFNQNNFWTSDLQLDFWTEEENLLENEKFEQNLLQCLNELPEKWNLALTYKYLTNKKASEICKELDITTTNYWQIVHRAKLLLKKCVETKWTV